MNEEEYQQYIQGMAKVEIAIEDVLGKIRNDIEKTKKKFREYMKSDLKKAETEFNLADSFMKYKNKERD